MRRTIAYRVARAAVTLLVVVAGAVAIIATSHDPIVWLQKELSQTLSLGEKRTQTVKITTQQDFLEDVQVVVTPSLRDVVSVQPEHLPPIVRGQTHELTVTFSAPPTFEKDEFAGSIQLHVINPKAAETQMLEPPLIVRLRLNPGVHPLTAEQTLAALVHELKSGNIEAALQRFGRPGTARDTLENPERRARLALSLGKGRLVEAPRDNLRIYKIPFAMADGRTVETDLAFVKNRLGEWVIASW